MWPVPTSMDSLPQAQQAPSCRWPSLLPRLYLTDASPKEPSSSSHLYSNVTFPLSPTSTTLSVLADQPPATRPLCLPPSALPLSFRWGTRKPESHQNHREGLFKHRLLDPSLASSQVVLTLPVRDTGSDDLWAHIPHTLPAHPP